MSGSGKIGIIVVAVAVIIAVAAAGLWSAGVFTPKAPAPKPPAPVKEQPQEAAKPAAPETLAAPVIKKEPRPEPAFKPVVLDVLHMTPAKAQIALGLPPLNGTLNKAMPLAKRLAPPDFDIEAKLNEFILNASKTVGVENAKTLGDIGAAKGLNLDAPWGLFADFSKSVESGIAAAEKAKAAAPQGKEPILPPVDLKDVDAPSAALVLGVSDPAKVEATIKELTALNPDFYGKDFKPVTVGNLTINTIDDYGYFLADNKLAIGTTDMVTSIAESAAKPAALPYGSSDCPATAPDEGALLLYTERLLPLLKKILPVVNVGGDFAPFIAAQATALETLMAAPNGEDPVVTTFAWTADKFEINTRMDTYSHPGLLSFSGQAVPMKYAQMLPESTLALVNLCLTPEWKKQIMDVYLKEVPKFSKDPGVAQGITIGNQVLNLLGQEITLGLAGAKDDFPSIFLMIGLAKPDQTQSLMKLLIPSGEGEKYKDIEIKPVVAEIPVPISFAFPGDMVLFSNNVDKMKTLIDMILENRTSGLFAALNPPLDPATPRYSSLLLNTGIWTDIVAPLNNLMSFLPAEVKPIGDQVAALIREVRLMNEMDGTWQASKLTVFTKNPS